MKKYICYCFLFSALSAWTCSEPKSDSIIKEYVLSVEVVNRQVKEVLIDNFIKKIEVVLDKGEDLTNVELKLTLGEGVSMVSPNNSTAVYNLENTSDIQLSAGGQNISFKISGTNYEPEPGLVTAGWSLCSDFGQLPEGISLYKSPDQLQNKKAVAYIAVAEIEKNFDFYVLGDANGYKTLTQFYEESDRRYPVIINAGYFWEGVSLSLICRDGQIITPNNQVVTRSDGSSDVPFYPTRGVFSLLENKRYCTDWVFTTVSPGTTYAYPEPAPNKAGSIPMAVPSATYPSGAWEFKAKTSIGGGPILIKDGKYVNSWEPELYDIPSGIGATANHPRTAIGYTPDNKLILFVCEGRNKTPGVPGFTLQEIADIMLDLGCVEALNLDGGGSSCMLVNGNETIIPSDGSQRPVVTAIAFK